MTDTTRMFVIRRHTPVRTVLLRTAALLIAIVLLAVVKPF